MGLAGGIGEKMLMKMGWSEGTGLGAKRDGIVMPVIARKRMENKGIGAERPQFVNCWWDKMMEDAYGKSEDGTDIIKAFEANGGIRCKAHGTAKLKRLEAHEMAALQSSDSESREDMVNESVKGEREQDELELVSKNTSDNTVDFTNSLKKSKKASKKRGKHASTKPWNSEDEKLKLSDGLEESSGRESENNESLLSGVQNEGNKCEREEEKGIRDSKLGGVSSKEIRKKRKQKKKRRKHRSGKRNKCKE